MEYIVGGIVIAILVAIVWFFIEIFFIGSDVPQQKPEPKQAPQPEPREQRPQRVIVDEPETPYDLRVRDGVTCAIAGISYWTTDTQKQNFSGDVFYLRREPTNVHDPNAIAVYAGKQKFGYLSAARAERYAPLLDQLGETFIVNRDLTRPRMSFIMPKIGDMRKMVVEQSKESPAPRQPAMRPEQPQSESPQ